MATREFFKYHEACDLVGDAEALRQSILMGTLLAFIELHEHVCTVHANNGHFPADGCNAAAQWRDDSVPFDPDYAKRRRYILSGWFCLGFTTAESVARTAGTCGEWPVVAVTAKDVSIVFEPSIDIGLCDLWFRAKDLEQLQTPTALSPAPSKPLGRQRVNEPLDARERTTLLRIVRALDVMANLPERGATGAVEKQLQELGFAGPKDATIRSVLTEARSLERDA